MRHRSKVIPGSARLKSFVTRFNSATDQTSTAQNSTFNTTYDIGGEDMYDELNDPRSRADRAKLQRKLDIALRLSDPVIRRSAMSDLYTGWQQVHKCQHQVTRIEFPDPLVFKSQHVSLPALSYTYNYSGGYGLARFGGVSTSNANGALSFFASSGGRSYLADPFHTPDWFALLDQWHEICNNIMPSTTLIGESMVENAIFVDAFKAVLNPSSLLKVFFKKVKEIGMQKSTLGKVAKALRTSSDSYLSYNFGVRPALDEISNILSAHRKVGSRLAFLRYNTGGYVPVRVQGTIPSQFANNAITSPSILCKDKKVVACISALGKVREDIDYIEDWKAYVQFFGLHKFIGLAWELVPFSFVVDWVTNAGEYVNKFTSPNFASPFYSFRNLCHSFKTVLTEEHVVPQGYYMSEHQAATTERFVTATATSTSYYRDRGIPDTSGSVDFSLLGTFHGITGGALLVQKLLK